MATDNYLTRVQKTARLAETMAAKSTQQVRRKCFVSYHVDDSAEVDAFIEDYGTAFIPRVLGVSSGDDFIDSTNAEYIKRRIRENYLSDSTVTICLLGKCTWGRRFVDWEIASSLRNDPINKRNGLLLMPIPSQGNTAKLPQRAADNFDSDDRNGSYTKFKSYPTSDAGLRSSIEEAFVARTDDALTVSNGRGLRQRNAACD